MSKIRTLIVDDDVDFCAILRAHFEDGGSYEIAGEAHDGVEALRMIRDEAPELVILDIILPRLDGIGVLEELRHSQIPAPRVVVFSAVGQDTLTRHASELGACAYFLKPFSMEVFRKRLDKLMRVAPAGPPEGADKTLEDTIGIEITRLLHQMAIPPHIKGYRYLRESVAMVVRDVNLINQITCRIYPHVAGMFDTTPSRVERAMRHAIEVAWNRCRVETIEKVFGYTVSLNKDKPSNGEFIAMIADKVRLKFGMC